MSTRPLCPPMPSKNDFSEEAWLQEKLVAAWYAMHETKEEWKIRKRQELEQTRKSARPSRNKRKLDYAGTVQQYLADLRSKDKGSVKPLLKEMKGKALTAYPRVYEEDTWKQFIPCPSAKASSKKWVSWHESLPQSAQITGALALVAHENGYSPAGIVPCKEQGKDRKPVYAVPEGVDRLFVGDSMGFKSKTNHPLRYHGPTHNVVLITGSEQRLKHRQKLRSTLRKAGVTKTTDVPKVVVRAAVQKKNTGNTKGGASVVVVGKKRKSSQVKRKSSAGPKPKRKLSLDDDDRILLKSKQTKTKRKGNGHVRKLQ